MKNKIKSLKRFASLRLCAFALMMIGLAIGFWPVPQLEAQQGASVGLQTRYTYLTNGTQLVQNGTNWIANNATVTITNVTFPIYRGRGMAFWINTIGTNSTTTNTFVAKINLTYDGTNYSTTSPIVIQCTQPGVGQQLYYTNVLADQFDNAKFGQLTSIQNSSIGATNFLSVSNIIVSAFP